MYVCMCVCVCVCLFFCRCLSVSMGVKYQITYLLTVSLSLYIGLLVDSVCLSSFSVLLLFFSLLQAALRLPPPPPSAAAQMTKRPHRASGQCGTSHHSHRQIGTSLDQLASVLTDRLLSLYRTLMSSHSPPPPPPPPLYHPTPLALLACEPVWPSGKAIGWSAEGHRFESASALL